MAGLTIGDVIAHKASLDTNTTAEDAIARLNLAKIGSLVTPAGQPLDAAALPYLRTLRNALFVFSDEVEREITRVERRRERAVTNFVPGHPLCTMTDCGWGRDLPCGKDDCPFEARR
jgi:hypothetical protein